MDDFAIKVENISKTFKLPHEKQSSVKSAFVNAIRTKRGFELQKALDDVSFEVKKGEFFGVVGRNGSGKSTLLKLLAGIYSPTSGGIQINGSLTPFIELGVGFSPELTGRENVYLNGSLLGFSRKEMNKMYNDIVEFAELEKFMDQKLKNYSSGMQVRLAFSIAIRAQSDILLIDEVLAVGDAAFQQKCFDVFSRLMKQDKTIILVTHDMGSVLRFCDRAMLLDDSQMIAVGKPSEIADKYLEINYMSGIRSKGASSTIAKQKNKNPFVQSVKLLNSKHKEDHQFSTGEDATLVIDYKNQELMPFNFGIQIFNDADVYCFGTNTKIYGLPVVSNKSGQLRGNIKLGLMPGNYYFTVATMNDVATSTYDFRPRIIEFRIKKDTELEGIANMQHTLAYKDV